MERVNELQKYYRLLELTTADLQLNQDDGDFSAPNKPNCESNADEEMNILITNLLKKKTDYYYDLKYQITVKDCDERLEHLKNIIGTGSNELLNMKIHLSYMVKNLTKTSYLDPKTSKQNLAIEKSVQLDFIEMIQILAKLCNEFDKNIQIIDNQPGYDWCNLIKKMEETVSNDGVVLNSIQSLTITLRKLAAAVLSLINENEIDQIGYVSE